MADINFLDNSSAAISLRDETRKVLDIYEEVTGPITIVPCRRYIAYNESVVPILTIPSDFPKGGFFEIVGRGNSLFRVNQSAGQSIYYDGVSTTIGTSGNISTSDTGSVIKIVCLNANTDFMVTTSQNDFILV